MRYNQQGYKKQQLSPKQLFVLWTFLLFIAFAGFFIFGFRLMLQSYRNEGRIRTDTIQSSEFSSFEQNKRDIQESQKLLERQNLARQQKKKEEDEKRQRLEMLLQKVQQEAKENKKRKKVDPVSPVNPINENISQNKDDNKDDNENEKKVKEDLSVQEKINSINDDDEDNNLDDFKSLTTSDLANLEGKFAEIIKEQERKKKKNDPHKMIKKHKKIEHIVIDNSKNTDYLTKNNLTNESNSKPRRSIAYITVVSNEAEKRASQYKKDKKKTVSVEDEKINKTQLSDANKSKDSSNSQSTNVNTSSIEEEYVSNPDDYDEDKIRKEKELDENSLNTLDDDEMIHRKKVQSIVSSLPHSNETHVLHIRTSIIPSSISNSTIELPPSVTETRENSQDKNDQDENSQQESVKNENSQHENNQQNNQQENMDKQNIIDKQNNIKNENDVIQDQNSQENIDKQNNIKNENDVTHDENNIEKSTIQESIHNKENSNVVTTNTNQNSNDIIEEEDEEDEDESSNDESSSEEGGFMDEFKRTNAFLQKREDAIKDRIKQLDSTGSRSVESVLKEIEEEDKAKQEEEELSMYESEESKAIRNMVLKALNIDETDNSEKNSHSDKNNDIALALKNSMPASLRGAYLGKSNKLNLDELKETTDHALEYVSSKRQMRFDSMIEKYSNEEDHYESTCTILIEPQVFVSSTANSVDIIWGATSCESYKPLIQFTQDSQDKTHFNHIESNVIVSKTHKSFFYKCTIKFPLLFKPLFYRILYVQSDIIIANESDTIQDEFIILETKVEKATLLLPAPRSFSSAKVPKYTFAIIGGHKELSQKQNINLYKSIQSYNVDLVIYLGGSELKFSSLLSWKKELFGIRKYVKKTNDLQMLFIPGPYDELICDKNQGFASSRYYSFTIAFVRFIVLDKPTNEQSQWLMNVELESDEFKSASFRVVLTYYTPFITLLTEEQKVDHQQDSANYISDDYLLLFTTSIDYIISGEQLIYQRQSVFMKQFITLGYTQESLYKIDSFNTSLTFNSEKQHRENSFGLLQIYDCTMIFKSINSRKQSLDTVIAKSSIPDCS